MHDGVVEFGIAGDGPGGDLQSRSDIIFAVWDDRLAFSHSMLFAFHAFLLPSGQFYPV